MQLKTGRLNAYKAEYVDSENSAWDVGVGLVATVSESTSVNRVVCNFGQGKHFMSGLNYSIRQMMNGQKSDQKSCINVFKKCIMKKDIFALENMQLSRYLTVEVFRATKPKLTSVSFVKLLSNSCGKPFHSKNFDSGERAYSRTTLSFRNGPNRYIPLKVPWKHASLT